MAAKPPCPMTIAIFSGKLSVFRYSNNTWVEETNCSPWSAMHTPGYTWWAILRLCTGAGKAARAEVQTLVCRGGRGSRNLLHFSRALAVRSLGADQWGNNPMEALM